jgi:hypothetical protein
MFSAKHEPDRLCASSRSPPNLIDGAALLPSRKEHPLSIPASRRNPSRGLNGRAAGPFSRASLTSSTSFLLPSGVPDDGQFSSFRFADRDRRFDARRWCRARQRARTRDDVWATARESCPDHDPLPNGSCSKAQRPFLWHYDGAKWSEIPTDAAYRSIHGTGPSDVWFSSSLRDRCREEAQDRGRSEVLRRRLRGARDGLVGRVDAAYERPSTGGIRHRTFDCSGVPPETIHPPSIAEDGMLAHCTCTCETP